MNSKIIAVDFDGTLCENKYPDIGAPNEELIEYLQNKKTDGSNTKIILWTCRTGVHLQKAVKWCEEHHLYFDAVNKNLPENVEWMGGDTRKIFANEYIDDRICSGFELPFVKEDESSIKSWAEKEIKDVEYCMRKLKSRSFDICDMYNLQIDFWHDLVDDSYSITAIKNNPIRHGFTISLSSSDLYNCTLENFRRLEQLIFQGIILGLEQYYEHLKEKRNDDIERRS